MTLKLTIIGIEVMLSIYMVMIGALHKSIVFIALGGYLVDSAIKHFSKI